MYTFDSFTLHNEVASVVSLILQGKMPFPEYKLMIIMYCAHIFMHRYTSNLCLVSYNI